MLEKQLYDQLMSKLRHGGVLVRFWDGDKRKYGPDEPYVTVTFHSPKALRAMARSLTLGFGEGYSKGLIDVKGPLTSLNRLISENRAVFKPLPFSKALTPLHRNVKSRQKNYIQHHYDIGNDFYKLWLDISMMYSCAYYKKLSDPLEKAQQQKVEHLLKKLQLQPGQRLLDIGSGWGTLLITAAKKYDITGLGITLSEEQLKHATEAAKKAGVSKKVSFELCNYQDLATRGESFDRIISVGMFEHVGRGNHEYYFKAVDAMLREGGLTVLHTITQEFERPIDPWIDKYIFPGGYLPTNAEITHLAPRHGFRLLDYENLRLHYAMTLEEWLRRYESHERTVKKMFDEQFYRMWRLWLASSAAGFRYGDLGLGQFVFSKGINNNLPLTREQLYR
ncbi:MAG TPA: cyclopropane-fatty-acyl-phospholipid synthase family protein [Candidatus Saccharimonadales bacterium]